MVELLIVILIILLFPDAVGRAAYFVMWVGGYVILFGFILLLFSGCSINHPYQVTEVHEPVPEETIIEVPRQELMGHCMKRGSYEKCANISGLASYYQTDLGKRCTIYLAEEMPPWQRQCILNHERKHCQVGDFHPGRSYGGCQ